jgi:hypothetical protein
VSRYRKIPSHLPLPKGGVPPQAGLTKSDHEDENTRPYLRMSFFTPLESTSIYAGDGRNRKHQLLIEGGVKVPPPLTGFTETEEYSNLMGGV